MTRRKDLTERSRRGETKNAFRIPKGSLQSDIAAVRSVSSGSESILKMRRNETERNEKRREEKRNERRRKNESLSQTRPFLCSNAERSIEKSFASDW